jgi:hypothetical protein
MNYLRNQQIFVVTTSEKCIAWSSNTHAVNVSELCMSNAAVCMFSFLPIRFCRQIVTQIVNTMKSQGFGGVGI